MKYLVSQGGRIHKINKVGDTPALIASRSRAWPVMQVGNAHAWLAVGWH